MRRNNVFREENSKIKRLEHEAKNNYSEILNIKKGQSYPAVLKYVSSEYDPLRKVYSVIFVYELYISSTQSKVVYDFFYLWNNKTYRNNTINRLIRTLEAYNLSLTGRDYRNEQSITLACSWLIGTRVELVPYIYKGVKYKVVSSERKDYFRSQILWNCLNDECLNEFGERIKLFEE